MNLAETLAALQDAGTDQNRQVYARHGAREPMFGVSWAVLRELARKIKTDDALAETLWDTGNYDARLLAILLADPARFDRARADRWLGAVDNYVLCEAVARLVARAPIGAEVAAAWRARPDEWGSAAGWCVTASLALDPRADMDDAAGRALVDEVQRGLVKAPNRTRHEMNMALIAIGARSSALRALVTAAAKAIGPVVVDHGETGCKTPAIVPYLDEMWARKVAKAERDATGVRTTGRVSARAAAARAAAPAKPATKAAGPAAAAATKAAVPAAAAAKAAAKTAAPAAKGRKATKVTATANKATAKAKAKIAKAGPPAAKRPTTKPLAAKAARPPAPGKRSAPPSAKKTGRAARAKTSGPRSR
jgi:hypothetical protein